MKPGDEVQVDLYWRALEPTDISYTVFFQLLGPDGQVYAQQDNYPGFGTLPTNRWQPGDLIRDSYSPEIAGNAPPGEYQIIVGFYDNQTGVRLPLYGSDETYTVLARLQVRER